MPSRLQSVVRSPWSVVCAGALCSLLLACSYVWFRVVDHLRIEWSLNEQYAYGWGVPFLCAWLAWRKAREDSRSKMEDRGREEGPRCKVEGEREGGRRLWTEDIRVYPCHPWLKAFFRVFRVFCGQAGVRPSPSTSSCLPSPISYLLGALLFAFLATRWIGEANPDWRLISWALALEAVSFSLLTLHAFGGWTWVRRYAFPILFFLVAVPWPTAVEQSVIQSLTRGVVAVTAELLNAFGVAAIPHGNTIETAGGWVDVDEGCSGIRSLQATVMLALFFGEFFRLSVARRLVLLGSGIGLAVLFNLGRTLLLTVVASSQGNAAVTRWHDPAGVTILVGCFVGVWAVATGMAKGRGQSGKSEEVSAKGEEPEDRGQRAEGTLCSSRFALGSFPFALCALLLLAGEIFIHAWYAKAPAVPVADWRPVLPTDNVGFKASELPARQRQILRPSHDLSATWQGPDATTWQFVYLRWEPGRTALHMARNHTPDICLPAAGRKISGTSELTVNAAGLSFPFRCYSSGTPARPVFVFYTLWEDGAAEQGVTTRHLDRHTRMEAVLQRRRNPGQRVIELAIIGARDQQHAEELLRSELPGVVAELKRR